MNFGNQLIKKKVQFLNQASTWKNLKFLELKRYWFQVEYFNIKTQLILGPMSGFHWKNNS